MVAMFTTNQAAFRLYDSDAGEASSTPLENQDVNHTLTVDVNTSIQVRLRVDETGGADGTSMDDWSLFYSKDGGTYVQVPTSDSGDGIRTATAGLTNETATTNRATNGISDGSGGFDAGEQSTDGIANDVLLTTNDFTEHVYGIEFVAANVADGATFDFQINECNAYGSIPRVTIAKSVQPVTASAPRVDLSVTVINPQAAGPGPVSAAAPSPTFTITQIAPNTLTGVNEKPSRVDLSLSPVAPQSLTGTNLQPPLAKITLTTQTPLQEGGSFHHDVWEDLFGRWEEYCQLWNPPPLNIPLDKVSITITPFDPEVDAGVREVVTGPTLSISTVTPVVLTGSNSLPEKVELLLNPYNPEVDAGVAVLPDRLQINLAAFAPEVDAGVREVVTGPTLNISTVDPSVLTGSNLIPGKAELLLNPFNPEVKTGAILSPGRLPLNLETFAPKLNSGTNLKPSNRSITLTAFDTQVGGGVNLFPGRTDIDITAIDPLGVFSSAIVKPAVCPMSLNVFNPDLTAIVAAAGAREYRLHRGKSVGGKSVSDLTTDVGNEEVSQRSNVDI